MVPYTPNLINLECCIENICRIVTEINAELIILDHHPPRGKLYEKRLKEVYEQAEEKVRNVMTAEYLCKTEKS